MSSFAISAISGNSIVYTIQSIKGDELAIIQENAILPISSVDIPDSKPLAVLTDKEEMKQMVISQVGDNNAILKIMKCESGYNPQAKNPKSTAYGLCQFLDSTWIYVQNKWGIALNRDSVDDQIYACNRLWAEEGRIHWLESAHCWE